MGLAHSAGVYTTCLGGPLIYVRYPSYKLYNSFAAMQSLETRLSDKISGVRIDLIDRLARIETRIEGLQWTVRGLYGLLVIAVFVNHFWK